MSLLGATVGTFPGKFPENFTMYFLSQDNILANCQVEILQTIAKTTLWTFLTYWVHLPQVYEVITWREVNFNYKFPRNSHQLFYQPQNTKRVVDSKEFRKQSFKLKKQTNTIIRFQRTISKVTIKEYKTSSPGIVGSCRVVIPKEYIMDPIGNQAFGVHQITNGFKHCLKETKK